MKRVASCQPGGHDAFREPNPAVPASASPVHRAKAFLSALLLLIGSLAADAAPPALAEALDTTILPWHTGAVSAWSGQTAVTRDGVDAAESGVITDGQQSFVETTVTGPAPVSFWWKVSSEEGYDQFQFLIDDVEQLNISGDVDWNQRTIQLPAGSHVLRWQYVKDATDSAGLDRAWLDQVGYSPPADTAPIILIQPTSESAAVGGVAAFRATAAGDPDPQFQWYFEGTALALATNPVYTIGFVTLNQAGNYWVVVSNRVGLIRSDVVTLTVTLIGDVLDAPNLAWSLGGDIPWLGQGGITHDGIDAAQSGAITNNQQSWVETTINGPGVLSYFWKVSSEPSYDGLQFFTNGVLAANLSGESAWEQRQFTFPRGIFQLRWRYFKDGSFSVGEDRGWLDEVSYLANRPPTEFGLTLAQLTITEGQTASVAGSFVDPDAADEHRVRIDWGDGSPAVVALLTAGARTFNSTHQYLDDPAPGRTDTNTITVTVSDEAGETTRQARLRVENAPPTLTAVEMAPAIYPFDTIQVAVSIADAGLADALRLSINWGDGTPLQSSDYPAGPRAVVVRHRYVLAGTNLVVSLILTDDDNGTTTVRTNLTIQALPAAARMQPVQRVAPEIVRLRGQGSAGARYLLEASTDLRRWSAVAVVTPGIGNVFAYDDVERLRYPTRFYRAVWDTQSPLVRFGDIWKLPDGALRIKLVGSPSTSYRVEQTDGFTNWVDFRTVKTDTNGVALFDDIPARVGARVYRSVDP